jgi:tetratricopeptide (TPR) repeat protein
VLINTVGIGSPEGSPIEDPVTGELKKDQDGHTVMSKLNEAELQQLATETNGTYMRLDNVDDALITMTQQLDTAEKKAMSDTEYIDYKSYFQWFLGVAILLLLAELLLAERRRGRPAEGGVRILVLVGFGLVMTVTASAQSTNTLIRSGNRAYKKNQLDQSLKQYQAAVDKAPGDPTANYNLGNAQFRKEQFDAAAKSYDVSVNHSVDRSMEEKGLYNKGVAMAKQKKLQESIDAWKAALKLNAADSDARENLEKALMEQKKQQQQQNQQKKNQDQKKDQKDNKDQKKNQDQQQQQQPKPQPSRLTKQQVDQLLKALQQRENDLQSKLNQNKVHSPNQPDKDW